MQRLTVSKSSCYQAQKLDFAQRMTELCCLPDTTPCCAVQRPTHGEPPMYDMRPGVPQEKRGNVDKVQVTVPFSDLRGLQQQPVLEKHGFERVCLAPVQTHSSNNFLKSQHPFVLFP